MTILDKLKKYFDETPREQVLKDWEETKEATKNVDSPTIEQFLLYGVSNTFKAQIQADIAEAKRTLKSTKENTAYSFEDAAGWVEEMNLIKGEIQGLTKALNYC